MKPEMAKHLKALEKENARLKKMVAEQALDMAIAKAVAKGNWSALNVAEARYRPCIFVWGQKESRSDVRAAFWVNHATPSDTSHVGRTMIRAYCTRFVYWLVNVLASDADAFVGC